MKARILIIPALLLLLMTAGCGAADSSPAETPAPTPDIAAQEEPTTTTPEPVETPEPEEAPEPDETPEHTDSSESPEYEPPEPPSAALDISHIPYFGDFTQFRLPAEHALAYAEAIKTAYLDAGWGHFAFDKFYPVLIDVSGDGIPLLLLVEKYDMYGWDIHWNILFGFADGAFQRITPFHTGIGIATAENERLLALVSWSDFGGRISLYRVQNGGAEIISYTRFFNDRHNEAFYIDDVEVSEEKFEAAIEDLSIEHLMETSHPGPTHSLPAFEVYLVQAFTREQVVQIFLDYAELYS